MGTLKGRRVLDVGCGRGYTLAALQRRGADVHGTQISSAAAKVAAGLVGSDRVFQGELADAAYPDGFFDCVTIWHVLEHVDEPVALLREVARILKPNGVVYVGVPNAGGWAARSLRRAWLAYDAPNHLYHFTPSTLKGAARRAGLRCTSETHFSLEYSPPTLLQTVLNASLGGDNLLFNTFAHSATDNGSHTGGTARLALHLAAGAIFALPVFCASVALGAAGAGDTYGAYFQHA